MLITDFAIISDPDHRVFSAVTTIVYMNNLVVRIDKPVKKDRKYL